MGHNGSILVGPLWQTVIGIYMQHGMCTWKFTEACEVLAETCGSTGHRLGSFMGRGILLFWVAAFENTQFLQVPTSTKTPSSKFMMVSGAIRMKTAKSVPTMMSS